MPVTTRTLFVSCVDGSTGLALDPERVQEARAEEVKIFADMGVYEHVSEQEFQADPQAKLICTPWVDCDKGSPGREEYRSRLCAQEFAKGEQRDDLFAGTPPSLATKLLASLCASTGQQHGKRLMVLDVKRAFLHGDIQRPVYIRLPAEDPKSCVPGLLGKLRKAMYGTRDAPAVWQKVVKEAMLSLGFVCSSSNPSVFRHKLRDILVVTHVDDFLCCAQRDDLDWLWKSLSKRYTLKSKVLGPNSGEFREIEFLGRRFAWTRSGITYEADPKHVRVMLEEWCMTSCNKVASPGVKDERCEEAEVPLAGPAARLYRRTVARLNYLAQDRADLAFATKEVARTMSAPSTKDVVKLKRILRYVRGHPRGRLLFEWQELPVQLVAEVDSDWAGCTRTRRSTSGGTLSFGKHCLAHWSRTQASVALSSGEAELNGALKGGCELLGAQHLCTDFGLHVGLEMHGDSTACRGMLHREGVGRMKHVEVKQMWLQGHIASGKIKFRQVPREQNTADAFTKHWTSDAAKHFAGISFEASGVDSACG